LKNLECFKGNLFGLLQYENIDTLAADLNLQIGSNKSDSKRIINTLIEKEKQCHNRFVEENHEVTLPTNLDVACPQPKNLIREDIVQKVTPEPSLKEDYSSPSWTEVVQRGKIRSKNNKIVDSDRRSLEY
jgi:hypothetical protein